MRGQLDTSCQLFIVYSIETYCLRVIAFGKKGIMPLECPMVMYLYLIAVAQVLNDQQKFDEADQLYIKAFNADPTNANLLVHRSERLPIKQHKSLDFFVIF